MHWSSFLSFIDAFLFVQIIENICDSDLFHVRRVKNFWTVEYANFANAMSPLRFIFSFFYFFNLCNKFSTTQRNFTLMCPLRPNRGSPSGNQYANYKLPLLRRCCGGKRTLVEHDVTYFLRWLALRTP